MPLLGEFFSFTLLSPIPMSAAPSRSSLNKTIPNWLILLGLLTALGPLAIDMYLPAFPTIARDLHTTEGNVERTLASYLIGIACAQLIYGPVADRFGRKIPLVFGVTVFSLASFGCALSTSIEELSMWRVIQAFGGAAGMAIPRAIIRDRFETRDAAKALSMIMLVMGAMPILAPIIGGQLLRLGSWSLIFVLMGVASLGLCIATILSLKESLTPDRVNPLRPGFIARSYVELLGDRSFIFYTLAAALGSASMFAYISGSARVFISLLGIDPAYFGLLFGLNALSFIIASQCSARLLNRYTPSQLLLSAENTLVGFIFLSLLLTLAGWINLYSLMFCLMGFMASLGFIYPNSSALALNKQGHRLGIASACMGTLQMLGGALAGLAMSVWHSESVLPMVSVLTCCASLSWLSSRIAHRLNPET